MFSNKDLKEMMQLSGVKNVPKLMESDHIDMEVAVEPDATDYGVPDDVGEPLAPAFEEPQAEVDEYGIPIEPAVDGQDATVMAQIPGAADNSLNQGFGGEMPSIGGMGGVSAEMPTIGGEMPDMDAEMPTISGEMPTIGGEMPTIGGSDEMTAQFAAMPDDEFMAIIQGGMPEMEEVIDTDNEDGEQSPVGSEGHGYSPSDDGMVEVEEEYDMDNGYEDQHVVDGEDYFPDGHDSNVRKKTGPLPNDGDNNLNAGAAGGGDLAESLYNKYKDEYAKFIKED